MFLRLSLSVNPIRLEGLASMPQRYGCFCFDSQCLTGVLGISTQVLVFEWQVFYRVPFPLRNAQDRTTKEVWGYPGMTAENMLSGDILMVPKQARPDLM